MSTRSTTKKHIIDVFAIKTEQLPKLYAYKAEISSQGESNTIGWKLAYQLTRKVGGHWVWQKDQLIADKRISQDQLKALLQELWSNPDEVFANILAVTEDVDWYLSASDVAEFVASGLARDVEREIRNRLNKYRKNLKNAYVERQFSLRGIVVEHQPAVAVSVFSNIVSTQPLSNLIKRGDDTSKLLGLLVKDKTSDMKGEITEIVGILRDHRSRLTSISKRQQTKAVLQSAPDDELVLKVSSNANNGYDYVASLLEIIVRTKDYDRLGIDGRAALSVLQLAPDFRHKLVLEIAQVLSKTKSVDASPYHQSQHPDAFFNIWDIQKQPQAVLGNGYRCPCDPQSVLRALRKNPPYRVSPQILNNTIRIGVLNAIGGNQAIQNYLGDIRNHLKDVNFDVDFTGAARVEGLTYRDFEQATALLAQDEPNIIMVFLPGSPDQEDYENSPYNIVKSIAIGQDLPSQAIYEHTLGNQYAVANIVLGIIAKTGNVPYVLGTPIPNTDVIAGIDVAREKTKRRSGSINAAAVTRVYDANGDFLRYYVNTSPIEGETLPKNILQQLFPEKYFGNRTAIIHRDGLFRGREIDYLNEIAASMNSDFHLVEIIKSGVSRMYELGLGIDRPQKGNVFKLHDREAYLVSSLPAHKNSTPRPLLVRSLGSLSIENALLSVINLTLLHYGSVRPPRLPVSIHYSDRIGYLALRGIKPKSSDGINPFWL